MVKTRFLAAEWRKLIIANYAVEEEVLQKYLPAGTEVDLHNGVCYVSLVGFMFLNTMVRGFSIPFHRNFPEVNLRFYVRYLDGDEMKRGVVFIKEIVPRWAITFVANKLYGEKYETMPMEHSWKHVDSQLEVSYRWKKYSWHSLTVVAHPSPVAIEFPSEEEFITNHFWGYSRISSVATSEYEVTHPTWDVYRVRGYSIEVDFASVYGEEFGFLSTQTPRSVFLAEGSEIAVFKGRSL